MPSDHHGLETAEDWGYCAAAVAGLKGACRTGKDQEDKKLKGEQGIPYPPTSMFIIDSQISINESNNRYLRYLGTHTYVHVPRYLHGRWRCNLRHVQRAPLTPPTPHAYSRALASQLRADVASIAKDHPSRTSFNQLTTLLLFPTIAKSFVIIHIQEHKIGKHKNTPSIISMPSPTPQPEPESQSPPPGPRAQRLHQIHAASLTRTLDKLAYENLAPCFPTIARRAEPILRQVQSQMVQKLREKSEAEFGAILRARGVVGKLNELEGVVAAAAEEQARVRAEEERTGEGEDDRIPYVFITTCPGPFLCLLGASFATVLQLPFYNMMVVPSYGIIMMEAKTNNGKEEILDRT